MIDYIGHLLIDQIYVQIYYDIQRQVARRESGLCCVYSFCTVVYSVLFKAQLVSLQSNTNKTNWEQFDAYTTNKRLSCSELQRFQFS